MRSRAREVHYLDGQGLPIIPPADMRPALIAFGVDPGNAIDDYQRLYIVAHGSAAFENSALAVVSALSSVPLHLREDSSGEVRFIAALFKQWKRPARIDARF
jgi:hypothetical protein